jgi:adenine-specific DNA methylase
MTSKQVLPFIEPYEVNKLPTTRYQGSKNKIAAWIWDNLKNLGFDTVLDGFGGTGVVSYLFKKYGKEVTYNDYLSFNATIARAIIENNAETLSEQAVSDIIRRQAGFTYDNVISRYFEDIYFNDYENEWLDVVVQNIEVFLHGYNRDLALYALFQSCIAKRPYNLFHRKNLYMRESEVNRSFGNKATWDKPFPDHFRCFAREVNNLVFDNGRENHVREGDVLDIEGDFDLVYLDPPYTSAKGVSVDYRDFYHFLEGLTDYRGWQEKIDFGSKHRRLKRRYNPWNDPKAIKGVFVSTLKKFRESKIAISYRADGIPTVAELEDSLRDVKKTVEIKVFDNYKYVLSNSASAEVLIIGY